MSATPSEQVREDYAHRMDEGDRFFDAGSFVEEDISGEVKAEDIQEKNGKEGLDSEDLFAVEIDRHWLYGSVIFNQISESDGENLAKPTTPFDAEPGNKVFPEWFSNQEIIDDICLQIAEDDFSRGIALTGRTEEVRINPDHAIGFTVYGEPALSDTLEEKLEKEYEESYSIPDACLGRVIMYTERKTSIMAAGYMPPEVDRRLAYED